MQDLNRVKRPNLVFEQMDATKMTYDDGKFSVVLDKGTLDALMPDSEENTLTLINKYLEVCNLYIILNLRSNDYYILKMLSCVNFRKPNEC